MFANKRELNLLFVVGLSGTSKYDKLSSRFFFEALILKKA
jgi:hypothetical protein